MLLRRLWRELLILLGLRRITPRRGERLPGRRVDVPALDTGGAYRPKHRPQDPGVDPREPYGSESSSRGTDHGWSGCTMSSSADAIAYGTTGRLTPWGGDMRHAQGDLEGGTDLNDAQDAFRAFGESLSIRSGRGWSGVKEAHAERRAIIIQGTGQVPGAGDFDGGHACAIGIETHSDGRWLFGDPLCSDWQWIEPDAIRSWAERWQSSIAFAVSAVVAAEPVPPTPEPVTAPACTPPGPELVRAEALGEALALDRSVGEWVAYLGPPGPIAGGVWDATVWAGGPALELAWLLDDCDDPTALWARGAPPDPAAAARHALETPALWDAVGWRELLWA